MVFECRCVWFASEIVHVYAAYFYQIIYIIHEVTFSRLSVSMINMKHAKVAVCHYDFVLSIS